jgi:large subunit ribosomal protein L6
MSRIGNKTIIIPSGVEVKINGSTVEVKGPKGLLTQELSYGITATLEGDKLDLKSDGSKENRKYHGLFRALLNNCVEGVSKGFSKKLLIQGVGFRAAVQGNKLVLQIGFCHPVELVIPQGLTVTAKTNTELDISGIDKQLVGEFSAKIRDVRKPEPYKGKGIRYHDEVVRRKAGKAMA